MIRLTDEQKVMLQNIGVFLAVFILAETAIGLAAFGTAFCFPNTVLFVDSFNEHFMVADCAGGLGILAAILCVLPVAIADIYIPRNIARRWADSIEPRSRAGSRFAEIERQQILSRFPTASVGSIYE